MRVEIKKQGFSWIFIIYLNDKQVFSQGFYNSKSEAIEASYVTIKKRFGYFFKITSASGIENTYIFNVAFL